MASLSLTSLFSLLYLLTYFSPSLSKSITISLSPLTKNPHTNPIQTLNHLTSTSLARAHHLKTPHKNTTSLSGTPLSPHSYGAYSMPLSFGTPPQTLDFIMDTGSSLVWFPCTHHYVCTNCDFLKTNAKNISTFIPKSSSSSRILGCRNHKCGLVFQQDIWSRCPDCGDIGHCDQACPAYLIQYYSGTTSGLLLSETLYFSDESIVKKFVVGCSILSSGQPSGIAGLGRGLASLPAQLSLIKFSYCLVSHGFDDKAISSELVLTVGPDIAPTNNHNVSYTPFLNNLLTINSAFQDYYYVGLQNISIGGEHIRVPHKFRAPRKDGNGGTIIDSGTTFTYMDINLFKVVASLFEKKMSTYRRATDVEYLIGLRPCFAFSGETNMTFPEFVFHFDGGSKMALPLADYFSSIGDSGAVCMTIVTGAGDGANRGPSIIIGNYQQQNFYMEFDLKNERLGFRKQVC